MLVSVARFSHGATAAAALLLLLTQSMTSACKCSGPVDTITEEFIGMVNTIGRVYVHAAITPPNGTDTGTLYYTASALTWFKNDIGVGKLIVKTSASGSECGATVSLRTFGILLGNLDYEVVPGYAGKVPTLTIDSCKPHKVAAEVTDAEWELLSAQMPPIKCIPTACDHLKKPIPDALKCPRGYQYNEESQCKGQIYGSCGWTVTTSCKKLPDPVVCLKKHCLDLVKPIVKCPANSTMYKNATFTCEKQASGACGWLGTSYCKSSMEIRGTTKPPVLANTTTVANTPTVAKCVPSDCDGLIKPDLALIPCPKTMTMSSNYTCENQGNSGSCGWTGRSECKPAVVKVPVKGNSTFVVKCGINACAEIEKPMMMPIPCPDEEEFVDTSTCANMKGDGNCGWNVEGKCQPKK